MAATASLAITIVRSSLIDGDSMDMTLFKMNLTMIVARISNNIVQSFVINGKISMIAILILAVVIVAIGTAISMKAQELSNEYAGEIVGSIGDVLNSPFIDMLPDLIRYLIDFYFNFNMELLCNECYM